MTIVSFHFIVFFLCTLLMYYIVPKKLQWTVLLATSGYFFVYASGWKLSVVLLAYLLINWLSALKIAEYESNSKRAKVIYVGTVFFNIVLLVCFKDLNLFKRTLNGMSEILGKPLNLADISIIAPLGISYFALILTGYVTDVYWEKFKPETNFFRFSLFGAYFPQMSSGPFVKYDEICSELFTGKKFDYDRCISGCIRILWGFSKKLIVAERLGVFINAVYADYTEYTGCYVVLAAVFFVFQLYADFSGAMDIVLGVSECFGIYLPENFDGPFFSTSIAEFWRRWHITLGSWLREYIFYPLQRSNMFRRLKKWCKKRFGKDYEKRFNLPVYLGMFITWFLIGAWHGGSWNCILMGSGLYFWFLITVSELCSPLFVTLIERLHINTKCFSWKLFQRLRTFLLFTFGLSFFRAANLREGFLMWKSAFSINNAWILFDESIYALGLDRKDFAIALYGVIAIFIVDFLKQRMNVREEFMNQNYVFKVVGILSLLYVVIIFGMYGAGYNASSFIYEQF